MGRVDARHAAHQALGIRSGSERLNLGPNGDDEWGRSCPYPCVSCLVYRPANTSGALLAGVNGVTGFDRKFHPSANSSTDVPWASDYPERHITPRVNPRSIAPSSSRHENPTEIVIATSTNSPIRLYSENMLPPPPPTSTIRRSSTIRINSSLGSSPKDSSTMSRSARAQDREHEFGRRP